MMQVKEVFKGHKARFYDEMEQITAKGDKKPQILFWGIWAGNELYSIILRSLDCKIGCSKIFLRFFLQEVLVVCESCRTFASQSGRKGHLLRHNVLS